jgi:hypothetical protein
VNHAKDCELTSQLTLSGECLSLALASLSPRPSEFVKFDSQQIGGGRVHCGAFWFVRWIVPQFLPAKEKSVFRGMDQDEKFFGVRFPDYLFVGCLPG